jgi:hypothetical protein
MAKAILFHQGNSSVNWSRCTIHWAVASWNGLHGFNLNRESAVATDSRSLVPSSMRDDTIHQSFCNNTPVQLFREGRLIETLLA